MIENPPDRPNREPARWILWEEDDEDGSRVTVMTITRQHSFTTLSAPGMEAMGVDTVLLPDLIAILQAAYAYEEPKP